MHAGLGREPARLAEYRATPRLRSGAQSTEQVWGNIKSTQLANLCADTIGEVADMPKTVWIASAATPHSASLFFVTLVCSYDSVQPAITRNL